jgi:co-chaperonin GroES (HSP10)
VVALSVLQESGDQLIQPRNDYLLVRRAEAPEGLIILPDIAKEKSLYGEVLAVGPGRWIPGEWWKVKGKWEWYEGYRRLPSVHVGQRIAFNSVWNDFAGDLYDDLPIGHDARLHLIQEGDIFSIY